MVGSHAGSQVDPEEVLPAPGAEPDLVPLGQGQPGEAAEEGEVRSVDARRPAGSIRVDQLLGTVVPTGPRRTAQRPANVPEGNGDAINDANPEPAGNTMFDVRDLVNALASVSRGARPGDRLTPTDLNKSEKPKWGQSERFYPCRQRVELWARAHNLQHLLDTPPNALESQLHDTMKVIISMQLPPHDLSFVADCGTLCEIWIRLKNKYMPSQRTELKTVRRQFQNACCKDGNVPKHTEYVHTLVNRMRVLGHEATLEDIADRMCDIHNDSRYDMITFVLTESDEYEKGADHVSRTLNDHYHKFQGMSTRSQRGGGGGGNGRGGGRFHQGRGGGNKPQNPPGAPAAAAIPDVAAVAADQEEWRTCHHCGVKGHVVANCPQVAPEVRRYFQGLADKKGRGGGGRFVSDADIPAVAAISGLADRFASMSDADLTTATQRRMMLIDSGSSVHVIRDADLFVRMGPSQTEFIKPVGPENLRVLGEGVVQFAVQRYTDVHGEVHSVVLEIPNCLYVPDCTFNLLSTSMLAVS